MNWFEGSVGDAVKKVKTDNRFLVVFLKDESADSSSLESILNDESFKQLNENFLGLVLIKGTTPESQFTSVYPVKKYPSINVIGPTGKRIRQIEQVLSKKALLQVIERSQNEIVEKPNSQVKEVNDEISRREASRTIQDIRTVQKEKEIAESKKDIEREKKESAEARLRVLQQIEDDKREKEFRRNMQSVVEGPACPLQNPHVTRKRHIAGNDIASINYTGKVQIRLKFNNGIGGNVTIKANSNETIQDKIRPKLLDDSSLECSDEFHLQMNLVNKHGYYLTQLRPPRRLNEEDERKSFAELGLVPNGVLIINPNRNLEENTSSGMSITAIPNRLLSIISWSFGLLTSTIGGIFGYFSNSPVANENKDGGSGDSKNSKKNSKFIRQGNTSRLSHMPEDSEDEQARWNGNSTSQL